MRQKKQVIPAKPTAKPAPAEPEKIKVEIGTVYQMKTGGNYYLRYQIGGRRNNVNLKTADRDEALKAYERLLPTLKATDVELVAAQVNAARKLTDNTKTLPLGDAWDTYMASPDRAMPATVAEQLSYSTTFSDFVEYIGDNAREIHTIGYAEASGYCDEMKKRGYAVDTHNRRVKRLRKVFGILKEYCQNTPNPFAHASLQRNQREDRGVVVRRLGFTREQEKALLDALDNPGKRLKNKEEIKVVFTLGIYTGQRLKDCVLPITKN